MFPICNNQGIYNSELVWKLKSSIIVDNVNTPSKDMFSIFTHEDDKRIRGYLYHIGLSVREMTKKPGFNKQVIDEAEKSDFFLTELDKLCNSNSSIKEELNSHLKNSSKSANALGLPTITRTKISDIVTDMVFTRRGESQEYVPCIFVYNIEELNPNLQPVISSGIPVNEELYPEFEDCYYFWVIQKDGSFEEIILSEEQAGLLLNPIFVVDNGLKDAENLNKGKRLISDGNSDRSQLKTNVKWVTNEFKINYRYEGSGDSEFTMLAVRLSGSSDYETLRKSNNNLTDWLEIASVDKDDIGTTLSSGYDHIAYFSEYGTYDKVFLQTYERDWIASKKFLGECRNAYQEFMFYGSVTYDDEWYTWTWYEDLHETQLSTQFGANYTFNFDESKGSLEIDVQ